MAADDSFAGFDDGYELPSADLDFSRKSENAPVNPEVIVDVKQDDKWVRIPVTGVTEWINKDGPSDMTRTAKVYFPYEWGDHSIIQYINGFNSQNNISDQEDPYDECRVFFYDHDLDEWVTAHYGYIGGIGPASESPGVGKFWVYDPADLMKGIQVSKSWGEPSVATVLDFVLRGDDDNGDPVGLEKRSVFTNSIELAIVGRNLIPKEKITDIRTADPTGVNISPDVPLIGSFQIPADGTFGSLFEGAFQELGETFIEPLLRGQKRFQINRNNMVDVMEWFTDLIDARWWFEPSPEGPVLVVDASAYKTGDDKGTYERRYFVEEGIASEWENERESNGKDGTYFATVDTLNNSALADIKPFNTLKLYGESTTLRERYPTVFDAAGAPGMYTEQFPSVEVTYPPLVERAGGYEYSAQPIESDVVYLYEAEQKAKKEFRNHIAEETEGSMQLRGEPHLMPYDYIVTVPTCNDTYINADAPPMTWEVNGVKHVRNAGEPYKTELGVSMAIDDHKLEVESKYEDA